MLTGRGWKTDNDETLNQVRSPAKTEVMLEGNASLDIPVQSALYFTDMPSEDRLRVELLQGTLDLIVLRALN